MGDLPPTNDKISSTYDTFFHEGFVRVNQLGIATKRYKKCYLATFATKYSIEWNLSPVKRTIEWYVLGVYVLTSLERVWE